MGGQTFSASDARRLAREARRGGQGEATEQAGQGEATRAFFIIAEICRVRVKNAGANAFSLVATLFWLHMLQPGRNMLVSGVRAVSLAPEQRVCTRRHNQTGVS